MRTVPAVPAVPAPGGAKFSYVAAAFLLFVTSLIAYGPDSRVCLYVMAGWTLALIAYVVRRFVPPETITSIIENVRGATADPPAAPSPVAVFAGPTGATISVPRSSA